MEKNKDYSAQETEKTVDRLIEDSKIMFPYIIGEKSKYTKILEYLFDHQDYVLTPAQIDFLLDYCRPPLRQTGDMCFPLLEQFLRSAERSNDLKLICKVYDSGIYLYENHEFNEKKIEYLMRGIEYFLSKHADENAGALYLKLAESCWVDKDIRIDCCEGALNHLAKGTEQYERAVKVMDELREMV